ncbi:hypothetical protein [Mesoterricola silvestris]|uniref:Uncharacterized protein n=1 Tax=Mesoterricola silvestris TaxID=2927979 RepID=A0AA48GWQ1_9BACT|nr:hypothetical protein [Mesoterricola silvestris]BDU71728.1 hypothetical protein METEAL_09020 [Mesoterricola silvestris]
MPDSAWDQAAPPPRKKGLSLLGKVAIGCGGAMLCFLLAIGAMAWIVFSKATKALDQGWAELHTELRSLRTEEGARALYRENPGLAQNYPTEEDFVKASAEWRGKLGDIPEKRPELKQLFEGKGPGGINIRRRDAGGRKSLTVSMRMSTGATLTVELENDRLTDIQVD